MRKRFPWAVFLLWVSAFQAAAQVEIELEVEVVDKETGEPLIGANVMVTSPEKGTITDEYGKATLRLPAGDSCTLELGYVGYQPLELRMFLDRDRSLQLSMRTGVALEEVLVLGHSDQGGLRTPEMSVEELSSSEVALLPLILGERDLLKALQLKPGIPSGSEGNNGFFVRGGGNDQNLFLLDGAPVFSPTHLFGFFSTFHTDAIEGLKLYKGGFPPRYGGRLSSIVEVSARAGDRESFRGKGGIGLLSSRLLVEGPLKKEKASFLVSGRRTYIDLFTRPINAANRDREDFEPIPNYNFYDLQAKLSWEPNEKDAFSWTGFFGRDQLKLGESEFDFRYRWGNAATSFRWNRLLSNTLSANNTLSYSNYNYGITNEITGFTFFVGSDITNTSAKTDWTWQAHPKHLLRFGATIGLNWFTVGRVRGADDQGDAEFDAGQSFRAFDWAAYVSDEWQISSRLSSVLGFRWSGFTQGGVVYQAAEPRINLNFEWAPSFSLKASYARMVQPLHLVSTGAVALPTDIWYPSTPEVRPQAADQVAAGLVWNLRPGWWLTAEAYYKRLHRLLDFVDGAELFGNPNLQEEFAIGRGEAYGMEWSLEKKSGKTRGWIGYTLAFTQRGDFSPLAPDATFSQQGFFSPIYDRRHDLSVVLMHEFSKRFALSATFVYGSGDQRWLPVGRTTFQDIPGAVFESIVPVFGDRNTYRLPPYHRLDLGCTYKFFPKWGEHELSFTLVNAYNRRNAYFVYFELETREVTDPNNNTFEIPVEIHPRQVSLFPIIPSLSWNFKF